MDFQVRAVSFREGTLKNAWNTPGKINMAGWKIDHLKMYFLMKIPGFSSNRQVSFWDCKCTWNPNGAPSFDWKRLCIAGLTCKTRGHSGSRYTHTLTDFIWNCFINRPTKRWTKPLRDDDYVLFRLRNTAEAESKSSDMLSFLRLFFWKKWVQEQLLITLLWWTKKRGGLVHRIDRNIWNHV